MATKLQLINAALAHLGEDTVTDAQLAADPPEPNVRKALAAYPLAADTAQAQAPWLCCLERATITRDPTIAGDWRHPHAFRLPVGALRLWGVETVTARGAGEFAWQAATLIDSNGAARRGVRAEVEGPLNVQYVRRTPEQGWSPQLADAFAYELASRLAGPIQSDDVKGARLAQAAKTLYQAALGAEAGQEGGGDGLLPLNDLTRARLSAS